MTTILVPQTDVVMWSGVPIDTMTRGQLLGVVRETIAALQGLSTPPKPVTVTVLDTVTGRTAIDSNWSREWWATGNGSCDCNRELLFGEDSDSDTCLGCHRYRIVAVGDGGPLDELNAGYE